MPGVLTDQSTEVVLEGKGGLPSDKGGEEKREDGGTKQALKKGSGGT